MTNVYLWINESKTGPQSIEEVWAGIDSGQFSVDTLCCIEGGADQWTPIKDCPAFKARRARRAVEDHGATLAAASAVAAPASTATQSIARANVAEAERLARSGNGFIVLAWVVFGLAVLIMMVAIKSGIDAGRPEFDGFAGAGAALALALWLYLIGQLILIRAAIERRN
jgi:hypothetical protein